ncbi:MAG: DUF4097 family beta strand repeat protein, partial [Candidatus Aminicenantes bacterium]|nr:DUF4097 family beta strand repeat protein [Candidatus Aminicenantes bacterium]
MTKSAIWGIVILFVLFAPFALSGETKTETIEKSYTIDDSIPVFLEFKEGDGNLKFSTWDKNVVQIRVEKTAKEKNEKRAADLLAKTKVEISRNGNTIRIQVAYPKTSVVIFGFRDYPRVKVETEIMLPHRANLTCRSDDGDIQGENVEGELNLRTDDGKIRVFQIRGSLFVETEDGGVECSEIMGSVEAISDDGDIQISGQLDWVDIRTEDGDIRAEILPGSDMERDWKIKSDDGNVDLLVSQDFAARIRIKT